MTKKLLPLLLILSLTGLAFGQARQRPARVEISQELTIPSVTSCDRLTNQQQGSLCFDINADPDGDGTGQGALYVYDGDSFELVNNFDAVTLGEIAYCDGAELSASDGQFLVYDADNTCFELTDTAPLANSLTQSSSPCTSGQYAIGWASTGALTCAPITDAAVPNDITVEAIDANANGTDEVYIEDGFLVDEVVLNPSESGTLGQADFRFQSNGNLIVQGASKNLAEATFLFADWASDRNIYIADYSGVFLFDVGGSSTSPQYNWPNADGTSGQALTTDGSGNLSWTGITATSGGSDTQVQFNDGGSFAGDADFTYDDSANVLGVPNIDLDADGTAELTATTYGGASASLDYDSDGTSELTPTGTILEFDPNDNGTRDWVLSNVVFRNQNDTSFNLASQGAMIITADEDDDGVGGETFNLDADGDNVYELTIDGTSNFIGIDPDSDGTAEVQIDGTNSFVRLDPDSDGVNEILFSGDNLLFEGSTDDTNEIFLTATDPTADRTITLPDASGTVPLYDSAGTAGNCVEWAAGGKLADAGAACGGGGGGGAATSIDQDSDGTDEVISTGAQIQFDPNDNGTNEYTFSTGTISVQEILQMSRDNTANDNQIFMFTEANDNVTTQILSDNDGDFVLWHRPHDADSFGVPETGLLGWDDSSSRLTLGSTDGHGFYLFPFAAKLAWTNDGVNSGDQAYQGNFNVGGSSLFHAGSTVPNVNGFSSDYPVTIASWGQDGEMINFLFPDAGASGDPGNSDIRAHISLYNKWDTFSEGEYARFTIGTEGIGEGWFGFHGNDLNNPLFRLEQNDNLAAFDLNDDGTDEYQITPTGHQSPGSFNIVADSDNDGTGEQIQFDNDGNGTADVVFSGSSGLKIEKNKGSVIEQFGTTSTNSSFEIRGVNNQVVGDKTFLSFGDGSNWWTMYMPQLVESSATGNRYVCANATFNYVLSQSSSACGSSSIRFKENVVDFSYGIDTLMALRPVQFDWIEGWSSQSDPTDLGFIAEEVAAVLPEAAVHEDGKVKNFEDRAIIALLVKVTQEQQRTIEELRQRIENLENPPETVFNAGE